MKGYLVLALGVVAACPAGAQVLLMPDSTNNRMVAFSPTDGSVVNSNLFAINSGTTPVHAMQVGNEIWVSEQVGDKISRWDINGASLGQIGGGATGGLDNIRGMALVNGTVYVTNAGTGNTAPSANAVVMYNTAGTNLGWFSTAALAPSPFGILAHQGGLIEPKRSPKNTRLYSQRDVERLRRIQQMTAEGLNLAGVETVLGLEAQVQKLRAEGERLRKRIAELETKTRNGETG